MMRKLDRINRLKAIVESDEMHKQLLAYSREPFQEVLAFILAHHPNADSLQAFADKHPDRWAQTISIFSKLSGYHDKLEIQHNIAVQISQMGDAQLLEELRSVESELKDVTPVHPSEAKEERSSIIQNLDDSPNPAGLASESKLPEGET